MNPTNSNVHKPYDTFAHFWWNVGHSVHQDPVVLRSCCLKWIFVLRFCSFGNILCKLSTSFALEHFLRLLSFLWWYHTDKWKTSSIKGWVFNPGERLERLERCPIRQTPLSTRKWSCNHRHSFVFYRKCVQFMCNTLHSCIDILPQSWLLLGLTLSFTFWKSSTRTCGSLLMTYNL